MGGGDKLSLELIRMHGVLPPHLLNAFIVKFLKRRIILHFYIIIQ
jgi:hypothetical protein